MSGKGSKPRPFSVERDKFESNWDKIFSKKTDDEFEQTTAHYHQNGVSNGETETQTQTDDRGAEKESCRKTG